ncbi:MAG: protein kinase [Myxococcota bacterium]
MLQTGFEVDRYVVEEKLGEGGMAVVYRVRHSTLGTRHALKVLSLTSRDVKERLIQEGRVQATLRHPNIVAVTDVLDVDGAPGLLMEFIQGPALDHWLYNYQPSIEEALTVFRGIVAGVGHAHSKGLIHRDLKPANVLLHVDDRGVRAKVTDFGLAKLTESPNLKRTRTGTTMGTPAYMAPEQIRDASTVDRRADLYSLGVILYELVCGQTPFRDDDIIELFAKVAAGEYPHPRELRPDLPNAVVDCIEALVEVNRDFRVSDCAAIIQILDGADKNVFTQPLDLAKDQELPPPSPLLDPGDTLIRPQTAAASAARMWVQPIATPAPAADRLGSLAPRAAGDVVSGPQDSALDFSTRLNDRTSELPVRERRSLTGVVVLVSGVLVAFLLVVIGLMGIALLFNLGTGDPRSGTPGPIQVEQPEPTVPEPVVPEPTVDPEPVVDPEPIAPEPVEPEPVKPAPVKPTKPAPVKPAPVKPTPVPSPTPAPTPRGSPTATATFSWVTTKGLIRVVLVDDETGVHYGSGELMEPKRYSILVDTPERTNGGAGAVTLRPNSNVELDCNLVAFKCKPR